MKTGAADAASTLIARWGLPLLLALCLAVFGPGINADYVWDDHLLIQQNRLLQEPGQLGALLTEPLWAGTPDPDAQQGYYRPLMSASLALDQALAPGDSRLAHAHSLAWHLLAVGLLWTLLRRCGISPAAALAGGALFALHPLQVEAVSFVSARNDPMASALGLGGLLLLSRGEQGRGGWLGGALALLAACLAKESLALAPLLLAAVCQARLGRFGPGGAYVAATAAVAGAVATRLALGIGAPGLKGAAHAFWSAVTAAPVYAEALLWPTQLAPGAHLAWPPSPGLGWLLAAAALALAALGLGGKKAAAGLCFAALALAPALAGLAALGLIADRYLALPLAGLALALGAALHGRRAALGGAGALLALLTALSSAQVRIWADDEALWTAAVARTPNPYVFGGYAKFLEAQGRLDEAAQLYGLAVAPPRPFAPSCWNIAAIHLRRGDPPAAVAAGDAALKAGCAPSPELMAPLAVARAVTGDWAGAEEAALSVDADPTGKAVLVRLAAAARRGDQGPLDAMRAGLDAPRAAQLTGQVAWLLEQAGEGEAAARLRAGG